MKYIYRWHNTKYWPRLQFYSLLLAAGGAECQSSWFSHSLFMYSSNWVNWWILMYSCKGSVTSTGITRWRWPSPPWKMICPKLEKQTNRQFPYRVTNTIKYYKRRHKEHWGGEASFASILTAFWWRWYVCSYLKDRKKYKTQRGEARTKMGGEQANLWDPTQPG